MDHDHMHHNEHGGGHGSMEEPMCNMNMIFTWDTQNLCVVFKWWRIETTLGLVLSLAAITLLGAGYEFIRFRARTLDTTTNSGTTLGTTTGNNSNHIDKLKAYRSAFYAFQVFYSFFLMLIFMTYNGWAMLAVTLGAFIGFYIWGDQGERGMSCH